MSIQASSHEDVAGDDDFQAMMDDREFSQNFQQNLRSLLVYRLNEPPGPEVIHEISRTLDACAFDSSHGVLRIAATLGVRRVDIDHLDRSQYGGGKPAMAFMEALQMKKGDKKLSLFSDALGDSLKPRSVVEAIQKKRLIQCIGELTVVELYQISDEMPDKVWKQVARYFDFSVADINLLASQVQESNLYSPTGELFNVLMRSFPDMPLHVVFAALPAICKKALFDAMLEMVEMDLDFY